MRHDQQSTGGILPRIALPPHEPVTPEEIERRRALFAKSIALREEIGPIGVLADELVHRAHDEAAPPDEQCRTPS